VSWPETAAQPRIVREDHGPIATEGTTRLAARAPGEKVVIAIGLASGDEFVAVEHATVG
jgi:hypothetical protein